MTEASGPGSGSTGPDDITGAPPIAPTGPAAIRADLSAAALRAAIRDDLVTSALRRRDTPGEVVVDDGRLLANRCDIASVNVNAVVGAGFGPEGAADAMIERVLAWFAGRPFLWWVGEDDTPADLGERLDRRGVIFIDEVPGMAIDLAELADAGESPAGLTIEPVLDAAGMTAFHEVLVQGFPEDFADDVDEAAIAAAAGRVAAETRYREPDGLATRWIGRVDGRAVATTRLNTAAGVAGIYAVITATDARRRGYGEAITRHVLGTARDAGYRIATLQASAAGRGVYERIGFRALTRFRLHESPTVATAVTSTGPATGGRPGDARS
jgi:ribosomal protein S18 acetylase RimI-like enzyme